MKRSGDAFGETVREVISYHDDVSVWVYLDQVDRVIRYEAYVVGYDESGEPGTLDFVIEEGVLDNMHEVPLFAELLSRYLSRAEYARSALSAYRFTVDGRLVAPAPLTHFYGSLTALELQAVHDYFGEQEALLKSERRHRWTRILRTLGYDVIPSL